VLLQKRKKEEGGGKILTIDPLTLALSLGFILMIYIIIINYRREKTFEIKNTFEIIISSFLSMVGIVYAALGAIHYGFFNQLYPGVDESYFRTIVTIGGIVTIFASIHWIRGLLIKKKK